MDHISCLTTWRLKSCQGEDVSSLRAVDPEVADLSLQVYEGCGTLDHLPSGLHVSEGQLQQNGSFDRSFNIVDRWKRNRYRDRKQGKGGMAVSDSD